MICYALVKESWNDNMLMMLFTRCKSFAAIFAAKHPHFTSGKPEDTATCMHLLAPQGSERCCVIVTRAEAAELSKVQHACICLHARALRGALIL